MSSVTHPSGVTVNYRYNASGHLDSHIGSGGGKLLHIEKADPSGRVERIALGSRLVTTMGYDPGRGTLASIETKRDHAFLQKFSYDYDKFGNLAARKDQGKHMEETFTYDGMDRLTGVTLKRRGQEDLSCSVAYDALGRMTSRQAVAAVNGTPSVQTLFSAPSFDATKVHAMTQAQASPSFPSTGMDVTYTGFDKVSRIRQGGDSLRYVYGLERQRIRMEEFHPGESRTKDYVGSCEFVTETDRGGTVSRTLTFVSGPCGVLAVVEREGEKDALRPTARKALHRPNHPLLFRLQPTDHLELGDHHGELLHRAVKS